MTGDGTSKLKTVWEWLQGFDWDKFILCIFMHMILPLAPLIIEFLLQSKISLPSLLISTSMYGLSLGSSSKKTSIFALSVVISLVLISLYGAVVFAAKEHKITSIDIFYIYCVLGLFFIIHIIERFKRHALDQEPFWHFS